MKPLLMSEIARAAGCEWIGPANAQINCISTDTRHLPQGCLFIALQGEHFDGNDYVPVALEQGAAFAIASRMPERGIARSSVLLVEDTRAALMRIANLYRNSLDVQVVGITGSVGKTTTKEMVACVMEAAFPTHKTPQNLNNEVGLSKTILALEEHHRVAVLEMGMDGPGQMAPLSRCAEPDIAILTNIGVSHIQQLGSREGIREEKIKITAGLRQGGTLILNGDDDMLAGLAPQPFQVLRYGIDCTDADASAEGISEDSTRTSFTIRYDGKRFDAQLPCIGRHNVCNALAAFLAGVCLGITPETAVHALAGYTPAGMRQKVVEHSGFTVVEDCYNASPDSMRAALETLGRFACSGRRIAVLSDMLELGDIAEESHKAIGRFAAQQGIDVLLCTGPLSRQTVQGAREAGMEQARHFQSQEALFQELKGLLRPGDVAWFKASRGMKLEQVIEKVYEEC